MSNYLCPICKREGKTVSRITVDENIKDYFKKCLQSSLYGLCTNPDCDVVYYNSDNNELYFERNLTCDIWYKNQINPVICYCDNVKLSDIVNEIAVKKTSKDINDIIQNTGAMNLKRCKLANPTGEECDELLKCAISYAENIRDNKDFKMKFMDFYKKYCKI